MFTTYHWKLVPIALVSMLTGGLLAMVWLASQLPQAGVTASSNNSAVGRAAIGGPFTLVNHKGKTVTQANFKGRYMLVYFGYTFCPDVCPTELQVMSAALEALPPAKAAQITPILVSIDPERDTPAKLAEYVANFHPRLVGLTGTPEQVRAAAKAYKVYFKKANDPDSSAGYAMDHSSIVYLMGPDGYFLKHFAYGTSSKKMARTLEKLVK